MKKHSAVDNECSCPRHTNILYVSTTFKQNAFLIEMTNCQNRIQVLWPIYLALEDVALYCDLSI